MVIGGRTFVFSVSLVLWFFGSLFEFQRITVSQPLPTGTLLFMRLSLLFLDARSRNRASIPSSRFATDGMTASIIIK
jgi:hypothetical protein